MASKRTSRHELDADDRNAMSDSTFAFPRLRKEPLNDASHVRNAVARFDQVRDVTDSEREEAFRRIKRAASKYGVHLTETRWQDLGKPAADRKPSDKPHTKQELYAQARRRGIAGRSSMTKEQLQHALDSR
jgi:hypothetical protein